MPGTLYCTRFLGEIKELERVKFKFSKGHILATLWPTSLVSFLILIRSSFGIGFMGHLCPNNT